MKQTTLLSDETLKTASVTQGDLGPYPVLHEQADVPARDGTVLIGDIYHPAGQADSPVILMRTPYGRANWTHEGIYWASHGYRTVVQDCRGTSSYFAEAADGADTVQWIEQAPWFGNALLLKGFSYLGFTAWATASTRPASLRALSIQVYSSDRVSSWYPGGSFGLDNALPWTAGQASAVDSSDRSVDLSVPGPDDASFNHLPLRDADIALTGVPIPFYRERLRYEATDPHWAPLNFSSLLSETGLPVLLVAGWYDFHRRYMWQDYQRLRSRAHGDTRLIVGPWSHTGLINDLRLVNAETRRWFGRHLADPARPPADPDQGRTSVRLYVTHGRGWAELPDWPPASATATTLYLAADHTLAESAAAESAHTYVYDPADPTPAVGVSTLGGPEIALPIDNRALEARPDVLTYTAPAVQAPVTLAGTAHASLFVNSTEPTADFFVRLTDVHPDGTSMNIVDGILRITPPAPLQGDTPVPAEVTLGPLAHRLSAGHALRVQVSSGAHPVYARNPGGTEAPATTTKLHAATQRIHLGGRQASAITIDISHHEIDAIRSHRLGWSGEQMGTACTGAAGERRA
jgi:uncharacterized protein